MQRLIAVAPRLRAKGAGAVIKTLLDADWTLSCCLAYGRAAGEACDRSRRISKGVDLTALEKLVLTVVAYRGKASPDAGDAG
jgi:hypothetical protein